jgi:hypothetical protein
LPAVLTSLTGLQIMSYCVTQRDTGLVIECGGLTDHGVTGTYTCMFWGYCVMKIHLVTFRIIALCIVVCCYTASNLRQYSLPKCWYPPVKLCCTDTIWYLQFHPMLLILIS